MAQAIVGWVLPLAIWLAGPPMLLPLAAAAAVVGEMLDRCAFYDALEIDTPRVAMAEASAKATAEIQRAATGAGIHRVIRVA
jgi:hypothetical protein